MSDDIPPIGSTGSTPQAQIAFHQRCIDVMKRDGATTMSDLSDDALAECGLERVK